MMTINQVRATLGWVYMMEVGTLECQKKKEDITDSIGKCCLATGDQLPRLTNCPSAWVAKMFEFYLLIIIISTRTNRIPAMEN
jgi:hypothetical protein